MNKEEIIKSLSAEAKARIKACKTKEEMLDILQAENIELDEDLLNSATGGSIAGGGGCGSYDNGCGCD